MRDWDWTALIACRDHVAGGGEALTFAANAVSLRDFDGSGVGAALLIASEALCCFEPEFLT